MKFIPCGVSRCQWKQKYEDLKPKFEKIKDNHDDLLVERENLAKIISEGKTETDPNVKEIITEKVNLSNRVLVIEKENHNLNMALDIVKTELERTKKLLESKTEEVINIKSKYELDEEITERKKEIKDLDNQLFKVINERKRLKKVNEKIISGINKNKEEYNLLADKYNEILDKIKSKKKELKSVKKKSEGKFKKFFFVDNEPKTRRKENKGVSITKVKFKTKGKKRK